MVDILGVDNGGDGYISCIISLRAFLEFWPEFDIKGTSVRISLMWLI